MLESCLSSGMHYYVLLFMYFLWVFLLFFDFYGLLLYYDFLFPIISIIIAWMSGLEVM